MPEARPLPPIEVLREAFTYDPDTGVLMRHPTYYNRRLKRQVMADTWQLVKCVNMYGYLVTSCGGQQVKAHRVCYALHHGCDPYPLTIDHIDRDRLNNRIDNLRAVTPRDNTLNRSPQSLQNLQSRIPIRITYPDGRGSIVCDSIGTAATLLNCNKNRLGVTIARAPDNVYRHNWGRGVWAKPSGIIVTYN